MASYIDAEEFARWCEERAKAHNAFAADHALFEAWGNVRASEAKASTYRAVARKARQMAEQERGWCTCGMPNTLAQHRRPPNPCYYASAPDVSTGEETGTHETPVQAEIGADAEGERKGRDSAATTCPTCGSDDPEVCVGQGERPHPHIISKVYPKAFYNCCPDHFHQERSTE